jgi:hypothetical protein
MGSASPQTAVGVASSVPLLNLGGPCPSFPGPPKRVAMTQSSTKSAKLADPPAAAQRVQVRAHAISRAAPRDTPGPLLSMCSRDPGPVRVRQSVQPGVTYPAWVSGGKSDSTLNFGVVSITRWRLVRVGCGMLTCALGHAAPICCRRDGLTREGVLHRSSRDGRLVFSV